MNFIFVNKSILEQRFPLHVSYVFAKKLREKRRILKLWGTLWDFYNIGLLFVSYNPQLKFTRKIQIL